MTQNEHVYAICCQLEVAGHFPWKRKDYLVLWLFNLEVASFDSFRDIKNHFVTAWAAAAVDMTIALSENAFAFRLKI